MLTETSLMDAENLPDVMRAQLDRPWQFIGEIDQHFESRFLNKYCDKCNDSPICPVAEHQHQHHNKLSIVTLESYPFITDDMLEITVYFGVCPDCQSVYWARQGPPFKRAICLANTTS